LIPPEGSEALPVTVIVGALVGFGVTIGVGAKEIDGVITNAATTSSDSGTGVIDATAEDSEEDAGTRVGAAGRGVGVTAALGVGEGTGDGVGAVVGVGVGAAVGTGVGVGDFVGTGVGVGVGTGSVPEGASPAKFPND